MKPTTMFRFRSTIAVIALMVVNVSSWGGAQEIPAEWGERWRPVLPRGERHPSLFFDVADRQRMIERAGREPWRRWVEAYLRSSYRAAPALKWWLTGDPAAARACRDNLVSTPIWRQKPQGYLEPSSHRFADYILAYDILAAWDGLSDEDRRIIRDRIAAEATYYYEVMSEGVPGGANFGNQRTLAASALGMAALVLCEYQANPGPAQWLRLALHEIRREENWWFFRPDGLFVEGLGYTAYMSVQFVPFAIAWERASGHYIFEEPRLREWLVFACYQLTNRGDFIMWGTCEAGAGLGFLAPLCNRRYGRDLTPLFYHTFNLAPDPRPHPQQTALALALYDPETDGAPPPPSAVFPRSQTVVLRESWADDAVAVWFAGKDGTWPVEYRYDTYSHGDTGHFVLVAWNEVLAADSGYDHWKSRDYYDAPFHNVVLIDGEGPARNTPGQLSEVHITGPVRHAVVTTSYAGCTLRRALVLVRGRYVVVADRIDADAEHEYTWQIRSACPPGNEGVSVNGRAVTWPGLSADRWRDGVLGRARLTTVGPPFAQWKLVAGRWRPISGRDEFTNNVALATWRARDTEALFVLLPDLIESPELHWRALEGQDIEVRSAGFTDRVSLTDEALRIISADGEVLLNLPM